METEFILALKNHLFFNVDVRSIYLVPNLIDENVKNNQMHVEQVRYIDTSLMYF